MWDEEFERIVRRHLAFVRAGDVLDENTDLRNLGLDSVATIGMLAAMEATYRIRFANEMMTMETFARPGVLWSNVCKLREAAGHA
jgi:nodulation protein F